MKKLLYISLGCLTFGLGTIGIFLPILPTTIFYILTAFFWMRSSEYLYTKFIESAYYQKYIQESIIERKITPLGRVKLFSMLFVIFALPCILVRNPFMTATLAIVFLLHFVGLNLYFNKKNLTSLKEANEE
ncbi:YbaN family protein [Enterococcus sp. AZ126]|uniref:YbaN family protein n=1 Tax=Enterococcus sp. AZ126 TaxID=2774635 RepID=UPI003F22CFBA